VQIAWAQQPPFLFLHSLTSAQPHINWQCYNFERIWCSGNQLRAEKLHHNRWWNVTANSKPKYGAAESNSELRCCKERSIYRKKNVKKTQWATDENCRNDHAHLPPHFFPFPVNPFLHLHLIWPFTLLHTAWASQPPLFFEHTTVAE